MEDIVAAFVFARGNSKRIPGKNKRELNGKPLIYYTLRAAFDSEKIDYVAFSSEDNELTVLAGDIAAELGQLDRLHILPRPKALSQDHVQTDEVALFMLRQIEDSKVIADPDTIVLLAPTSPMRTTREIDHAIDYFNSYNGVFNSLISVVRVRGWFYNRQGEAVTGNPALRQGTQHTEDNTVYQENGSIYVCGRNTLSVNRSYRIPPYYLFETDDAVDLDTPDDWAEAEVLLEDYLNG